VKQLYAHTRFPSRVGWTIALLDRSVEQLVELGIEFAVARDDLDSLKTALFEDRYIGQLRLLRYDRSPAQGIDVQVDATVSRERGLAALKRQLDFGRDSLNWISEYRDYPGFWPDDHEGGAQPHPPTKRPMRTRTRIPTPVK